MKEDDTAVHLCPQSCFEANRPHIETRAERVSVRLSTRVAVGSGVSRRRTIVEIQHAAQTLTAQHRSTMTNLACIGHNHPVAETLVVSLTVIMQNELVNSLAQRAFTEDAANKALRTGV